MKKKNKKAEKLEKSFANLPANNLTSAAALVGYAYFMRGDGKSYAEFAAAMVLMYNLDGKRVDMSDLEKAWKESEEFFQ